MSLLLDRRLGIHEVVQDELAEHAQSFALHCAKVAQVPAHAQHPQPLQLELRKADNKAARARQKCTQHCDTPG